MTRRRLEPEQRKRELIEFGRSHFAAHRYDAFPLEQIAAMAGVSKATLYNYFGSRRGFYMATIQAVVDEVLVVITPPTAADAPTTLLQMLRAFVSYASDNQAIYLALVRGGLGSDAEVAALLGSVRRAGRDYIDELWPGLSPTQHLAVALWLAGVEAATADWLLDPKIPEDEVVDMFANTFASIIGAVNE